MRSKVRLVFGLAIVLCTLVFLSTTMGLIEYPPESDRNTNIEQKISGDNVVESDISEVDEPITVASTQGFPTAIDNGEIVAFTESGEVVYHESDYGMYFDIYPVESEEYTIRYTSSETLSGDSCSSVKTDECTRSVYREVNMSTEESRTIYSEVTPHVSPTRWHDVDEINSTHIVVASILHDGVFTVNTETGEKEWVWNASEDYDRPEGEELDWTHLNDVDVLEDDTIMISLRNQDQVVFIEKGDSGYQLNESRTLGTDNDYSILREQHNPDYFSSSENSSSVIVGDSENNRIVEYERTQNGWERSFTWSDERMQWPRDADRLPNGNTLITDSNGERVLEIDSEGDVVWSATIGLPYEAERLGTGEESSVSQNTEMAEGEHNESSNQLKQFFMGILPNYPVNGLLFILPHWILFTDLLIGVTTASLILLWVAFEISLKLKGRISETEG